MTQYHNPNYRRAPKPEITVVELRLKVLDDALDNSHRAEHISNEPIITVREVTVDQNVAVKPQIDPTDVVKIRERIDAAFMPTSPVLGESHVAQNIPANNSGDIAVQLIDHQPVKTNQIDTTQPEQALPSNVLPFSRTSAKQPPQLPIDELYRGKKSA